MKKTIILFLCMLLCASCLSGCLAVFTGVNKTGGMKEKTTETADSREEKDVLPGSYPMELTFASGVGAWSTRLNLQSDGTFEGNFHDTNMGETGEDYPHGTMYVCNFRGKFGDIKRINDFAYKMTLEEIYTEERSGEEWIEDKVLYIASDPYGMDMGRELVMYTPETKVDGLSEDFLSWWPYRLMGDKQPDTLSCYGIYNIDAGTGFFTYE